MKKPYALIAFSLYLIILILPVIHASSHGAYSEPRQGFTADTKVIVEDTLIYATGYISDNGSDWTQISLNGDNTIDNWVMTKASSSANLTGIGYVAIYSCTYNQGWNCSQTWQVLERNQSQTNTSGSIQGDYDALQELYTATNGDGWWNNTGWQDSTPETMDQMYGITVWENGADAGRVRTINLHQNNLVGSIENVSFEKLDKVQELTLKQPMTEEEFFSSNPDGQIATTPPPKIYGKLPPSIGGMTEVEWLSLGGQYCRIDLAPNQFNEWNHCAGFGSTKKFVNGNFFEGELPPEWGGLRKLRMLELRRSNVQGEVPPEWESMTSLEGIFLNDNNLQGQLPPFKNSANLKHIHLNTNRDSSNPGFSGQIPESYTEKDVKHLRLRFNSLNGKIPVFDKATDIRVFDVTRNDLERFPQELFEPGRNPKLIYFIIGGGNQIGGTLENVTIDPSQHAFSIFGIGGAGIGGEIPSWATELGGEIWSFGENEFTSLAPEFYEPAAPVYHGLRTFRLANNELTSEIPDVLFAEVLHEGTVEQVIDPQTIIVDVNLGVVEQGTIDRGGSSYIVDESKAGQWTEPWFDHQVTIDPQGNPLSFEVTVDWRLDDGMLFSLEKNVSGTEGLDYIIEPLVENRIIRFQTASNRWEAREIISYNKQTRELRLDQPLEEDVLGKRVQIHDNHSPILRVWLHNNHMTGQIPESWNYIPTYRPLRIEAFNNELNGTVPDLSQLGSRNGGSLERFHYYLNNFVFSDILENFAANDQAVDDHRYAPQKPFGQPASRTVAAGGSITLDDFSKIVTHADNQYQWYKEGTAISGATSREYTISNAQESDLGTYTLQVNNPGAPALTLESEPVTVE